MSEPTKPRHVPQDELEVIDGPVTRDGGDLRVLQGSEYDVRTTIMHATIVPGSGPMRHRHPHAEIFVLHDGQGRYEVEGTEIDAVAGDMVIIPPNAWHVFRNTGGGVLRHTAIHQNSRAVSELEDGTHRD